jgi:L-rhamnose mutarotase
MRQAWVMWLKPGMEALYKQRHDEIWPELVERIRAEGIRNFSIYRHGLLLFAYLERDEPPPEGAPVADVTWRWWESMAPLMETNPDFSPVMEPVEEMFHLD